MNRFLIEAVAALALDGQVGEVHVARLGQPQHHVGTLGGAEVDGDAKLAPIVEVPPGVGCSGLELVARPAAQDVARRRLDLDNSCAEVGHHRARARPGDHVRDLEHAHAV